MLNCIRKTACVFTIKCWGFFNRSCHNLNCLLYYLYMVYFSLNTRSKHTSIQKVTHIYANNMGSLIINVPLNFWKYSYTGFTFFCSCLFSFVAIILHFSNLAANIQQKFDIRKFFRIFAYFFLDFPFSMLYLCTRFQHQSQITIYKFHHSHHLAACGVIICIIYKLTNLQIYKLKLLFVHY